MKKENFLKMNLHYFDEGNNNGTGGSDNGAEGNDSGAKKQSFDDVLKNKEYQQEFDRRISKALETAREKWQGEAERQLEEARNEAAKLAKMTAEEKAKHEAEKREKSLLEREQAVTKRELMAEAKNTLAEKGIPQALAEILNYTDAESCKSSIENIEKAFRDAVEGAVADKLKGGAPLKKAPQEQPDSLEGRIKKSMKINY